MMDRILVIGGAGGIGSAIVDKYHRQGHCVIIGDNDKEEAENILKKYSSNCTYYYVDVLNTDSISTFRQNIEKNVGSITHLISLAGNALDGEWQGIEGTDIETINKSIDLNLKSHLYLIKEFLLLMEADQNENKTATLISSINALRDYELPAYSSAKAGLLGLVYSTTGELAKKGIRINAVLPGTVETPRTLRQPKDFDKYKRGIPMSRFATCDEIANVVYSLTHSMTCVTGQYIVADCGQMTKSYR